MECKENLIIEELCEILKDVGTTNFKLFNDLITTERKRILLKQIEVFVLNILQCLRFDSKFPLISYRAQHWNNIDFDDEIARWTDLKNLPIKYRLSNLELNTGKLPECYSETFQSLSMKSLSNDNSDLKMRNITFKTTNRAYSNFLLSMKTAYNCLQNNTIMTKRQIFYENVKYVKDQQHLNQSFNQVCCYLNCAMYELNIFGAQKSLMAGPIRITLSDTIMDYTVHSKGSLLPLNIFDIQNIETTAKFVLLVEKDTVFERLINDDFLNKFYPCILLTGKGYGDISIRKFTSLLVEICNLPIYGLFDADPHGIDIMCNYKYGSLAMSFNSKLAIPSLQWIGVFPSEVIESNITTQSLNDHDIKKITSLMKRPYLESNSKLDNEIQILKNWNIKSEIEDLYFGVSYLTDEYLYNKLKFK